MMSKAVRKMQERVNNDEIRTAICGGAFWSATGIYLSDEEAETLSHTNFPFSLEETMRCKRAQDKLFAA